MKIIYLSDLMYYMQYKFAVSDRIWSNTRLNPHYPIKSFTEQHIQSLIINNLVIYLANV